MAFTDALIDHADVSVILVDRRHAGATAPAWLYGSAALAFVSIRRAFGAGDPGASHPATSSYPMRAVAAPSAFGEVNFSR